MKALNDQLLQVTLNAKSSNNNGFHKHKLRPDGATHEMVIHVGLKALINQTYSKSRWKIGQQN